MMPADPRHPPRRVHVIRMVAPIGDHLPKIGMDEVRDALAPDEPVDDGLLIDLHALHLADGEEEFWARSSSRIDEQVRGFVEHRVLPSDTGAVAVFAFAPIPLLARLGRALGDKAPTRVFERHRHTESWRWEDSGERVEWETRRPTPTEGVRDVAVALSVSARVQEEAIRAAMHAPFDLIELSALTPRPNLLRREEDLRAFADVWRGLLNHVAERYGTGARIHLFPASPLSVSAECGRRMLPKADPTVTVYDFRGGAFHRALDLAGVPAAHGAGAQPVDVAVLIALEEEFRVFDSLFGDLRPEATPQATGYDYRFEVARGDGGRVACVARMVGAMGPGAAQLEADRIIERHRPGVVVMLGIAAAMHGDVRLGDVLVADQVDAYDATQKAVPDGGNGWTIEKRGEVFRADFALVQEVANFSIAYKEAHKRWQDAGEQDLNRAVPAKPRRALVEAHELRKRPQIHRGHLASGATVGAAKAFKNWLKARDTSIKALEMEAAGLARSASLRQDPVRIMVIRGVSDAGNEEKSALDAVGEGVFRALAMRNATRLFRSLVETGVFGRR